MDAKRARVSRRQMRQLALCLTEDFFNLRIRSEEIDFKKMMTLAIEKSLTVYDAAYLELARSKKASLLTLDKRLRQLAK